MDIPSDIKPLASGYTRKYTVVRVHDGVAQKLDTTLNSDGTLTFKTSEFSTYAITYQDIKIGQNPKTGDNVTFYIGILVISLVGLAISTIYLRKNKTVKSK